MACATGVAWGEAGSSNAEEDAGAGELQRCLFGGTGLLRHTESVSAGEREASLNAFFRLGMGLLRHTVSAGETEASLRQGEGEAVGVRSKSAASLRAAGVHGLLMGETLRGVMEHTLLQN